MFAFECRRFAKRLEYLVDILELHDPNQHEAPAKKLVKGLYHKFSYNSNCQLEDLVKYLRKLTRRNDTAVLG
jgi:hypothetical protein